MKYVYSTDLANAPMTEKRHSMSESIRLRLLIVMGSALILVASRQSEAREFERLKAFMTLKELNHGQ